MGYPVFESGIGNLDFGRGYVCLVDAFDSGFVIGNHANFLVSVFGNLVGSRKDALVNLKG